MNKQLNPYLIGICGGSASGKTTVIKLMKEKMMDEITIISLDNFYKGLTDQEINNVENYNFDSPDAFDWDTFYNCIINLKKGDNVQIPIYDFKTHSRVKDIYQQIVAKKVIVIEGIMIFEHDYIRKLFDFLVFVDADNDTRLERRIMRDINERGRDLESIFKQYKKFVKPMFNKYILPVKKYVDIIVINEDGNNFKNVDAICDHLTLKLRN